MSDERDTHTDRKQVVKIYFTSENVQKSYLCMLIAYRRVEL